MTLLQNVPLDYALQFLARQAAGHIVISIDRTKSKEVSMRAAWRLRATITQIAKWASVKVVELVALKMGLRIDSTADLRSASVVAKPLANPFQISEAPLRDDFTADDSSVGKDGAVLVGAPRIGFGRRLRNCDPPVPEFSSQTKIGVPHAQGKVRAELVIDPRTEFGADVRYHERLLIIDRFRAAVQQSGIDGCVFLYVAALEIEQERSRVADGPGDVAIVLAQKNRACWLHMGCAN